MYLDLILFSRTLITVDLQWLEPCQLVTTVISKSFLSPQQINPVAADMIVLGILSRSLFILIMLCCVSLLESPQ